MRKITAFIFAVSLAVMTSQNLHAIPPEQMKPILNMTKSSWVAFRDYNGKQLIYFTHLESYKCGIQSVHYSINSDKLDKVWELEVCNPKNPLAVTKDNIYLSLPLHSAKSISVKLIFADGSESEVVTKTPEHPKK